MSVFGLQTEIFQIVYYFIVHLPFVTLHNLLFLRLSKASKKQYSRGFLLFFSRKTIQILIFKVRYFENDLTDFNDFGLILQDFERHFRSNQRVSPSQFLSKQGQRYL